MTTIEYLLNKFPVTLQKKYKEKCNCQRHDIEKLYNFELIIEVTGGTDIKGKWTTRYCMYFRGGVSGYCRDKIIGPVGGIGFLTQKEALKELLRYKKEIRN